MIKKRITRRILLIILAIIVYIYTRKSLDLSAKRNRNAYATLCYGDAFVIGTLVLFHSLKKAGAQADFVALAANISTESIMKLQKSGIVVMQVEPLIVSLYHSNRQSDVRDSILWTKLRVWQLENYSKVVMLDSDLFVLQNSDELFNMPEFSSTPMVDLSEKSLFFSSAEMGLLPRNKVKQDSLIPTSSLLEHWSGVNSGVSVLVPNNATFTRLLNELSIIPHRLCCPSQEFLYYYFSERNSYYRLPPVYNGRMMDHLSDHQWASTLSNIKIYHFLGSKPWKRKAGAHLNKLWWAFKEEVQDLLKDQLAT